MNKVIVLVKRLVGKPMTADFTFIEEPVINDTKLYIPTALENEGKMIVKTY